MKSLFGANWRTTLTGWFTLAASSIALNPSVVTFIPEPVRSHVIGVAGLVALLSGGTFAYSVKDKQVTGGTEQNDQQSSSKAQP
jgi:hypothetical protein